MIKNGSALERWTAATVISVALNLSVLLLIGCYEPKPQSEPLPIMTVRLAEAREGMEELPARAAGASSPTAHKALSQAEKKKAAVKKLQRTKQEDKTSVKKPIIQQHADKSSAEEISKAETAPLLSEGGGEAVGVPGSVSGAGSGASDGTALGSGNGAGGASSGGIADVSGLEVLKKVLPEYPLFSRKRKEEGTSVVIAELENGAVIAAQLEKTSGFERLDAAALKAVKGWKFRAKASMRVRIPFAFKIIH